MFAVDPALIEPLVVVFSTLLVPTPLTLNPSESRVIPPFALILTLSLESLKSSPGSVTNSNPLSVAV